jgi:oligopeptide transport system ATP-binding protein
VKGFAVSRGLLRRPGRLRAVDGVSLSVARGETFAIVGESGCGKSTLARLLARLAEPDSGRVLHGGRDVTELSQRALRPLRRDVQMIFQDPFSSLNPRMTVGALVEEPMRAHGIGSAADRRARAAALLARVGLRPELAGRYPHEFSGGQRQRIGIARALALDPSFIVCDEPIAALDVSIQAQVVNLLEDLQQQMGLTYLFISHDLSMVRHIATEVAVMYLGTIVELAQRDQLYASPRHPYTQALLSAVPVPDPEIESTRRRVILKGDVPSPANPPSGCRFRTRCPIAEARCAAEAPAFRKLADGRRVACHFAQ